MSEVSYCTEFVPAEALLPLEIAEGYIPSQFTGNFDPRCPTPKELAAFILLERFMPGEQDQDRIMEGAHDAAKHLRKGLDNDEMPPAMTFLSAHVLDPRRDTPMSSPEAFMYTRNGDALSDDTASTIASIQEFTLKASKRYFLLRPAHFSFGMSDQQFYVRGGY